jgi:hypothetical protein
MYQAYAPAAYICVRSLIPSGKFCPPLQKMNGATEEFNRGLPSFPKATRRQATDFTD